MYEKLKQVMREAGYAVSEGADWLATDMQHFTTFSRQVLGATTPHLNHLLAYPQAFPHVIAKAEELAGSVLSKVEEFAEEVVASVESVVEPTVPEAVTAEPADNVLDVSATGQTAMQDLSAVAPPPDVAQEQEPQESADQSTSEQTPADQSADQSTQPPADEAAQADQTSATEGDKPQE